jgi:hypothetical protein
MFSRSSTYVPMRLFLDSNTQQALVDHGGTVFEGESYAPVGRSGATEEDVHALAGIFHFCERAHFEFVVSPNSLREAADSRDGAFIRYAQDVAMHWSDCIESSAEPFEGSGPERVRALDDGRCGYLSPNDMKLVRDAVLAECDTFLTIERKLPRNADHLRRVLGIEVLRPPDLWAVLRPHLAAL